MSEPTTEIDKMRARKKARLERGSQYRALMYWSGKALEIPLSVVVGLVLGTLADNRFETAPWGKWIGLAAGVGAAVRFTMRLITAYKREFPDE